MGNYYIYCPQMEMFVTKCTDDGEIQMAKDDKHAMPFFSVKKAKEAPEKIQAVDGLVVVDDFGNEIEEE